MKKGLLLFALMALVPATVFAQISFHTRSVVACDPDTQECGIAVVSFPSGVPAVVPVGTPGVIVANQATPSLATARDIIDRIKLGAPAPKALADALVPDTTRESRQLGVAALDASATTGVTVATFTGSNPGPETCGLTGGTYAVQANVQTSSAVCATVSP